MKVCNECGSKLIEYKEKISTKLVSALHKIARHTGEVDIKNIELTRMEWTNFTRLTYWGFVTKGSKRSFWTITEEGRSFLRSQITVQETAWIYHGDVIRREGRKVGVQDIYEGFDTLEDFIRNSRPHNPDQINLF